MGKKILLGMHHLKLRGVLGNYAVDAGCVCDVAGTIDDMLHKSEHKQYDLYFMDANLGCSGSADVTPALQMYAALKERVACGAAKFMTFSNSSVVVGNARDAGLPAMSTEDFCGLLDTYLLSSSR